MVISVCVRITFATFHNSVVTLFVDHFIIKGMDFHGVYFNELSIFEFHVWEYLKIRLFCRVFFSRIFYFQPCFLCFSPCVVYQDYLSLCCIVANFRTLDFWRFLDPHTGPMYPGPSVRLSVRN